MKKKCGMKTTSTEVEEDVYLVKKKLSFSIVNRYFLYIDGGTLINLSLPSVLISADSIKT